ncbi:MAG TPA: fluoride efflux transporter CrcB [Planctomycetota bacterium]|nr:fluoride efflux transporter CrcB [Planctomycetota bacterium]
METLLVGIGGSLGAMARYGLSGLVHKHLGSSFPYGTLVVNFVGCLAIGCVLYLVEDRALLGVQARLFAAVGIIGGFTTFSAFGHETLQLLRDGRFGAACLNVGCSVVLGLFAVWLGRTMLRLAGV